MSITQIYALLALAVLLLLGSGVVLGWVSVVWEIAEKIIERLRRKKD